MRLFKRKYGLQAYLDAYYDFYARGRPVKITNEGQVWTLLSPGTQSRITALLRAGLPKDYRISLVDFPRVQAPAGYIRTTTSAQHRLFLAHRTAVAVKRVAESVGLLERLY